MANEDVRDLVAEVAGSDGGTSLGPKLDLWLSYYRVALASIGLVLVLLLLPGHSWVVRMLLVYLVMASLVPLSLRIAGTASRKALVRPCVLLSDVIVVSLLAHAWGARSSPAAFMYLPIVVGWTLVPQPKLGRLSLVLVLLAMAILLFYEEADLARTAVARGTALPGDAGGAFLFFGFLASAVVAVHQLLDFTVVRLHQHARVVGQLIAEKQAREREAQWAARLEEAHRLEALGRLAGGVAHDFNNVLTALLGFAELAEAQLTKDPKGAATTLQELERAAERAGGLTTQLLEFASRRPSHPRDIDLNAAVSRATALLQRLLKDTVELRIALSREPCHVRIDPSSLERLLVNLVINAADAMPEGGLLNISTKRVESDAGASAVLEVQDTGVGIAPSDVPRLFEPFFTRKARGKGTGLGLSSVYGIVKQSNGEIDVETALGKGSLFRVRWPLLAAVSEPEVAEPSQPSFGNETVLVVDDDPAVRAVIVGHLQGAGYSVLPASSGEQALALLAEKRERVALLVSDVSMPGMSGSELTRIVHERAPGLPVLLISGYADELSHDETPGAALGVSFLAKPFSRERLLNEVRTTLDVTHSGVRPAAKGAEPAETTNVILK